MNMIGSELIGFASEWKYYTWKFLILFCLLLRLLSVFLNREEVSSTQLASLSIRTPHNCPVCRAVNGTSPDVPLCFCLSSLWKLFLSLWKGSFASRSLYSCYCFTRRGMSLRGMFTFLQQSLELIGWEAVLQSSPETEINPFNNTESLGKNVICAYLWVMQNTQRVYSVGALESRVACGVSGGSGIQHTMFLGEDTRFFSPIPNEHPSLI